MWRRGLRETTLGLVVLFGFLAPGVWAASQAPSSLIQSKNDGEYSLERDLGDGVTITCEGVSLKEGYLHVEYAIFAEEDIVVKIDKVTALFDDRGGKLDAREDIPYISIGEEPTREREVIAGIKTHVIVKYPVGGKYELANKYARVSVTVNGQELTFREITGKK
jgi:hypothetical protein